VNNDSQYCNIVTLLHYYIININFYINFILIYFFQPQSTSFPKFFQFCHRVASSVQNLCRRSQNLKSRSRDPGHAPNDGKVDYVAGGLIWNPIGAKSNRILLALSPTLPKIV